MEPTKSREATEHGVKNLPDIGVILTDIYANATNYPHDPQCFILKFISMSSSLRFSQNNESSNVKNCVLHNYTSWQKLRSLGLGIRNKMKL